MQAHWPVAREPWPGVMIAKVFNSRVMQQVLPPYYTATKWEVTKSKILKVSGAQDGAWGPACVQRSKSSESAGWEQLSALWL